MEPSDLLSPVPSINICTMLKADYNQSAGLPYRVWRNSNHTALCESTRFRVSCIPDSVPLRLLMWESAVAEVSVGALLMWWSAGQASLAADSRRATSWQVPPASAIAVAH